MPRPIKLLIPKPCSENWHEMTPTEKGAFCKACKSNVVDFTTKTNTEIFDIIQSGQSHCGRFREDQIGVNISRREVSNSFLNFKAMAAAIAALFATGKLWAAGDNDAKPAAVVSATTADTSAISHKTENKQTIVNENRIVEVKGRVVDTKTRKPLEDVSVYLNHTNYITRTDKNGNFSLLVNPDSVESISFSQWGHAYTLVPLTEFKKTDDGRTLFKEVGMKEEEMKHVMGIYIKIPE